MEAGARRRGNMARGPENEFDAGADIEPDRRVEPKGVKRGSDQRAGNGEEFDNRQRQRIAYQHISTEIVEMISHEARGRGGRAESRNQNGERLVEKKPRQSADRLRCARRRSLELVVRRTGESE